MADLSGITYLTIVSGYDGDITKNCSLTGKEVDNNFYFLRGNDINDVELNNSILILTKVNGEKIFVDGFNFDSSLTGYCEDNTLILLHNDDIIKIDLPIKNYQEDIDALSGSVNDLACIVNNISGSTEQIAINAENIDDLYNKINSEIITRQEKDNILSNDIDNISAITQSFSGATVDNLNNIHNIIGNIDILLNQITEKGDILDRKITAETKAREDAVSSAITYVNDVFATSAQTESAITTAKSEAIAAAEASAQTLDAAVKAEASARSQADVVLEGKITAETKAREDAVSSAITYVNSAIATAKSEAIAAAEASAQTLNNIIESTKKEIITLAAASANTLYNSDIKDIKYNKEDKRIYAEFKDGHFSEGFDASAFLVDGVLSAVTYDTTAHTMTFIWNTESQKTPITIHFDDIIAPYEAGDGLVLLGNNSFKIKIKENERYLSVDNTGIQTKNISQDIESAKNDAILNASLSANSLSQLINEEIENRISTEKDILNDVSAITSDVKNLNDKIDIEINNINDKLISEVSSLTSDINNVLNICNTLEKSIADFSAETKDTLLFINNEIELLKERVSNLENKESAPIFYGDGSFFEGYNDTLLSHRHIGENTDSGFTFENIIGGYYLKFAIPQNFEVTSVLDFLGNNITDKFHQAIGVYAKNINGKTVNYTVFSTSNMTLSIGNVYTVNLINKN